MLHGRLKWRPGLGYVERFATEQGWGEEGLCCEQRASASWPSSAPYSVHTLEGPLCSPASGYHQTSQPIIREPTHSRGAKRDVLCHLRRDRGMQTASQVRNLVILKSIVSSRGVNGVERKHEPAKD